MTPTQRVQVFAKELGKEMACNRRDLATQAVKISALFDEYITPIATELERVTEQRDQLQSELDKQISITIGQMQTIAQLRAQLAGAQSALQSAIQSAPHRA